METFSALLAICAGNSPAPGEFPAQRPVMRSFDVFFDLRLNKRLSKQSWGWWFETLSRPLWRHRNGVQTPAPFGQTKTITKVYLLAYHTNYETDLNSDNEWNATICFHSECSVATHGTVSHSFKLTIAVSQLIVNSQELWNRSRQMYTTKRTTSKQETRNRLSLFDRGLHFCFDFKTEPLRHNETPKSLSVSYCNFKNQFAITTTWPAERSTSLQHSTIDIIFNKDTETMACVLPSDYIFSNLMCFRIF